MSKRWFLLSLSAFFFLQFIFFSYLVHKNIFKTLDFNTTVVLQNHVSKRFDGLFSLLSDIGKFEIVSIVLIVFFLVIRKYRALIVATIMYGCFHVIELFGKFFVDHLPPPQFMLRTEQVFSFPQFHVRSEFSYPSGHSGRALFMTVLMAIVIWESKRLSLPIKIGLTLALALYDFTMVLSRVVLGEHWLTDIIGGSILGAGFAFFAGMMLVSKEKASHDKTQKGFWFPKYKLKLEKVE